ncbi:MAG: hydantoinase B/oxoprolinase family protein [Acidimicrobiales bacterium]
MDPVTLAVLHGRLEQLVDEMDATLFRSAFNPSIADAHDASHGIYQRDTGATVAQGSAGLPVFVGSMAGAVEFTIDKAREGGGPASGDIWVFNDPYRGGTHLNDMKLVQPFFHDGELFCWLASVGHYTDVGGAVPGNYNPSATESAQEGVLIPPMRLRDRGELRTDVVDLICSISRVPTNVYGDLNGQLNALDLGTKRLGELIDEFGASTVRSAFDEMTSRAAHLMRAGIADLPDGTFSVEDYLDNDGSTDEPVTVALDLTINGDRLVLDFTRTSSAVAGPINISRSTAVAACYVGLKHIFVDVPANAGCLEPVEVIIPEGSLLDAEWPRPVAGYTETILRVMDCIFSALAMADPDVSNGASYGTINALSIAGRGEAGERWVMFTFYGGGLGGNPHSDGLTHGNAPLSTATIPPIEILEAAYPIRYTRWALRPDSGGPGRHRGGLGAEYEIELLADEAEVFAFGDRGRFGPPGVAGGSGAARNEIEFMIGGARLVPPLVSKIVGVNLEQGDSVRIFSPGGGGYGDPAERDPADIERDLRLGYVTRDSAVREYGVEP